MFCATCGTQSTDDSQFCANCGNSTSFQASPNVNDTSSNASTPPTEISPIEAYKRFWINYLNIEGLATRPEYWWVVLIHFGISIVIGIMESFIGFPILSTIYMLAVLIPNITLFIRRMHDIGKSGWNWFWALLPIVGWIILIIYLCTPSKFENNRFRR